ncbi:MAG: hypothetical protein IJP48_07765 [Synergistaceae bacterium]|nr:hypothetical protein [Synergistaceae bacterium]
MRLLNPCRKCGSVSIALKSYKTDSVDTEKFSAECRLCGNQTPFFNTEAEAINFWNNTSQNPAKKLAQLVQDMRDSQKRYFKTRDKDALIESKRLEAQVDKYVSDIMQSNEPEMKDLLTPMQIQNDMDAVNVESLAVILEWLASAVKHSNGSGVRLFAKSVGEARS